MKKINQKKVAIVTGASKGIGKAIALGLAKDNYRVALIARSQVKLQMLSDQIVEEGGETLLFPLDITQYDAIPDIIQSIKKEWHSIDVLVNNAGQLTSGSLKLSLADYQHLLDINFKAQLAFIQAVLPVMQQQHHGYVLNIASIAGKIGYAGIGAYCASKFALVGLNESLHQEFADQGIKFTAICPAWVNTDMAKEGGCNVSSEKIIQPQDIEETVRWLLKLSPSARVKEIIINCGE